MVEGQIHTRRGLKLLSFPICSLLWDRNKFLFPESAYRPVFTQIFHTRHKWILTLTPMQRK